MDFETEPAAQHLSPSPMRSAARILLICLIAAAACIAFASPASAEVNSHGYIALADGTQLAYSLSLPSDSGRFPVAFTMDHYGAGGLDWATASPLSAALLKDGYAVLGVDQPGSGCSSGTNDWMDSPAWSHAGAQVVEWAAAQPWSTGHVGMWGWSWDGITQLGIAEQRPPHLDAISPIMVTTDFYRDVIYPGGVNNAYFSNLYSVYEVPGYDITGAFWRLSDAQCSSDFGVHAAQNVPSNPVLEFPAHPFDDAYYAQDPSHYLNRIGVPVLGCQGWQDGSVNSRATEIYLDGELNPGTSWLVGTNGAHGECNSLPDMNPMILRFLDHFVKGQDNGWESTPHLTLEHDVASGQPAWTSTVKSLIDPVKAVVLHAHGDGSIDLAAPAGDEPSHSYASPTPGQSGWSWSTPEPDTYVSYTTPPLTKDAEFFGPASANVWMSSTAPDTDAEAIVTEVRPDGQEQFVAAGWLRLSQRKLDPDRSSALRPYQTHQQADLSTLTPTVPTYTRIEIFPFEHVFRAGSSIRLTIDAAAGAAYGNIAFAPVPTPAVNTVYEGPAQDTQLVLGLVPHDVARAPWPACGTIDGEACRTNPVPVPGGSLTIPERAR
jgi:predicted acyl esterase